MPASSFIKASLRRWGMPLIVLALTLVAVGLMVLARSGQGTGPGTDQLTFTVERGPLTISVTESGTIKARDQEILKNEVEGQTTIIQLVPEGKLVKAGELLVTLDASTLEDRKVDQQIQAQNVEAAFIRASENLEVAKSQAESDVAKAELDYRFAQEDVNQYLEGQFPQNLKEVESKITLAKEELERATEKLKWSETLFEEKYISQTELEADRLTKNRAELDHELAVASRNLLKNFTYKRTLAQRESDVDQARMALERVRRKAQADIVQAEADLKAKDLEFKQQQDKLKKIEDQITKTKIYAPIDGMVIYATSARSQWFGNQEPLAEGQNVREREELIYLPTADAMMAELKVHESNLDKVALGLPARVTVDALPGRTFDGQVASIAPLPDAQSLWLNPDMKIYSTQIHLAGSGEGLRTGMSCRVEIIVEQYDDVVYVPIHTVLRVGDQPTVYVLKDNRVTARPIQLGLDNNLMVRIVSGLEPGEEVLHNPPLAPAAAPPREAAAEPPREGPTQRPGDGATPQPREGATRPFREGPAGPPREGAADQPRKGAAAPPREGATRPFREGTAGPPAQRGGAKPPSPRRGRE